MLLCYTDRRNTCSAIGMAVDSDNVDGDLWVESQFSPIFDGDKVSLPTADPIL